MCLGSGVPGGSARAAPRGVLGGLQFLALKITSLIKVFYSLVYKVLFNQFRLFFDNSFSFFGFQSLPCRSPLRLVSLQPLRPLHFRNLLVIARSVWQLVFALGFTLPKACQDF